jgi:uncharacterized protein YndB with AHSA1/START domain
MEARTQQIPPRNRIYKTIVLRASRAQVWRAISDEKEFGAWFGATFDGPFVSGSRVTGTIVPTTVDPAVAAVQKRHAGYVFDLLIDRIEPERLMSFRWHPFTADGGVGYGDEATTLVSFELNDDPEGVVLTITESGFDRVPRARRAQAFTVHEEGWEKETLLIQKHVARS